MKTALRLLSAATLVAAGTAIAFAAHTHVSTPSTWALDVKASDFGGGPSMKSDVITIITDTDKWLKFTEVTVDGDGKTWKTSWSGPQDGTFRPLAGMPGASAAFKTADDSSILKLPDGTEIDCTFSMDSAKKKLTEKCTVRTRGRLLRQQITYNSMV